MRSGRGLSPAPEITVLTVSRVTEPGLERSVPAAARLVSDAGQRHSSRRGGTGDGVQQNTLQASSTTSAGRQGHRPGA